MKLKQALLNCLLKDQLKGVCEELEVEADRRSQEAMVEALAGSKKAKPVRLIEYMNVGQLKNALELMELPTGGRKEDLVERLLAAKADGPGHVKEIAVADAGKPKGAKGKKGEAKVTRYTFDDVQEPASPETGHTSLLPEEETVTLPMDNGWSKALHVGKLPESDRSVVVDMDPAADPVLFWAGKRNRRQVPVLPLQRNEVVTESRIAQIIERAQRNAGKEAGQASLFADLEKELRQADQNNRVEFYKHDENWKNKLICGDSLEVMESLMHYEGLRGKVQMIYIDPPYGISYDSNFQQRVDVARNAKEDAGEDVLSIRAFRDTWTLGIHTYLGYLSERLYLCRELLTQSGSVFVQIGDQNIHWVRAVMAEVFGEANFMGQIAFVKTTVRGASGLDSVFDHLLWYAKDKGHVKFRPAYFAMTPQMLDAQYDKLEAPDGKIIALTDDQLSGEAPFPEGRRFRAAPLSSQGASADSNRPYRFQGKDYFPPEGRHYSVKNPEGLRRLEQLGRLLAIGKRLYYKRYGEDFPWAAHSNVWLDTRQSGFGGGNFYVVQTSERVVRRCVLMTSDPGDLVFDPTCGSGTTAACAEQFGRRWITCDTSRVAVNVARQRLMARVYPHYHYCPAKNRTKSVG